MKILKNEMETLFTSFTEKNISKTSLLKKKLNVYWYTNLSIRNFKFPDNIVIIN